VSSKQVEKACQKKNKGRTKEMPTFVISTLNNNIFQFSWYLDTNSWNIHRFTFCTSSSPGEERKDIWKKTKTVKGVKKILWSLKGWPRYDEIRSRTIGIGKCHFPKWKKCCYPREYRFKSLLYYGTKFVLLNKWFCVYVHLLWKELTSPHFESSVFSHPFQFLNPILWAPGHWRRGREHRRRNGQEE